MSTAILTIPIAEWNTITRFIREIKGERATKKVDWVKVGVLIKLGWTREQIRYRRNDSNSRSEMKGKYKIWEYDKSKFIK